MQQVKQNCVFVGSILDLWQDCNLYRFQLKTRTLYSLLQGNLFITDKYTF